MRKTSDGLPRYDDQQDTFVLSGAEDLVAVDVQTTLTRYRPRTEGLFARIVHHRDATQNYWKVESKDGLSSFYGTPATAGRDPATLADPDHVDRVFAWKLIPTIKAIGTAPNASFAALAGSTSAIPKPLPTFTAAACTTSSCSMP